jgi:hypothetical protein
MCILLENILISKDYTLSKCIIFQIAAVVELVDTSDSKSDSRKGVTVQVRSAVPFNKSLFYAKLYKYLNNESFFTGPYYIKKINYV